MLLRKVVCRAGRAGKSFVSAGRRHDNRDIVLGGVAVLEESGLGRRTHVCVLRIWRSWGLVENTNNTDSRATSEDISH